MSNFIAHSLFCANFKCEIPELNLSRVRAYRDFLTLKVRLIGGVVSFSVKQKSGSKSTGWTWPVGDFILRALHHEEWNNKLNIS